MSKHEVTILDLPIWEISGRWQTNNFFTSKARVTNPTLWAYHALPRMIRRVYTDTDWIMKTADYNTALEMLHHDVANLSIPSRNPIMRLRFRKQVKAAIKEIAELEAYIASMMSDQESTR